MSAFKCNPKRMAQAGAAALSLIAASSSQAFTNEEWSTLPFDRAGDWYNFKYWAGANNPVAQIDPDAYSQDGTLTLTVSDETLTGNAAYDDIRGSVVGFLNLYGKTFDSNRNVSPTLILVTQAPDNTFRIDMGDNPHAGVLVTRTTRGYYTNGDVWSGTPRLIVDGALSITGDVGAKTTTDFGDFTTGIGLGQSDLIVNGDLTIDLTGMNSQSPEERTRQVPVVDQGQNFDTWSQYYGWTVFDTSEESGNEGVSFIDSYLVQAGLTGGFAHAEINGNVDVVVSGKNGFLAGIVFVPNVGIHAYTGTTPDYLYKDGTQGLKAAGDVDVYVQAESGSRVYGLTGLMSNQYSTAIGGDIKYGKIEIGGDLTVTIRAEAVTSTAMPNAGKGSYPRYADDGTVSGVYLRNSDLQLGTNGTGGDLSIDMSGIEKAPSIVGLYLYGRSNLVTAGDVSIRINGGSADTDSVHGLSITNAIGDYAPHYIGHLTVDIESDAKTIYGLNNLSSAQFYGSADITIKPGEHTASAYAIYQPMSYSHTSSVYLNWDVDFFDEAYMQAHHISVPWGLRLPEAEAMSRVDGTGRVRIVGDIALPNDGKDNGETNVWANFTNGSWLIGAASAEIYGTMSNERWQAWQYAPNLWMRFSGEGNFWDVTGDSSVTTLVLDQGARVILANHGNETPDPATGRLPGFGSHVLNIRNFIGSPDAAHAGVFHIDLDYSNPDLPESGFLAVIGTVAADRPYATVEVAGSGYTADERTIAIALDSTPAHNLVLGLKPVEVLDDARVVELGAYLYKLENGTGTEASFDEAEYAAQFKALYGEEDVYESGDVIWFLTRTPTASPTADDVVSVTGFGSQIGAYLTHLSTLRDRMGELRWKGANGLWARATATKDRLAGPGGTAYKDETYAGYLGYDHSFGDWTVGADIRIATSDYKAYGLTNLTGEGDAVGGALYATGHNDNGWYADLVLAADRFDQSLRGTMLDGVTAYKGDYRATGLGASLEAGKTFWFDKAKVWFVEPAVQLSYYRIKGETFKLSNGMRIDQGDAESLTGRLGLTLGHNWYDWEGKPAGSAYLEAGVNHEFKGKQRIAANDLAYEGDLLGTRVYYGLALTRRVAENTLLWLQLGREQGGDYTREYDANIGVRCSF